MENIEKIDEILSSDEFIKKILEANSSEEVKKIFKEKDIDVTDEQIENMRKALNSKIKELNTMSDDEMGQISGGKIDTSRLGYAAQHGAGKGAMWGTWIGAGVGATAGMIDGIVQSVNGNIDSAWGYFKVVAKDTLEGSLLGTLGGGGVGVLTETANEFGKQGKNGLKNKNK